MAGVTIIGTGELYTTIGSWESAFNTASLIGVEEGQLKAEQYSEIVNIDGGATTATDYCHLTTAEGAEYDHVAKTGARIVVVGQTAETAVVTLKDPYHKLGGNTANNGTSSGSIGIRFEVTNANNGIGVKFRYAGDNEVSGVVVYDSVSVGNAFGVFDDGSSTANIRVINSGVYNLHTQSTTGGDAVGFLNIGGTNNLRAFYCLADNIHADAGADDAHGFRSMLETANCWAGECVTLAPAGLSTGFEVIGSIITCGSDDGTGSVGLQNLVRADQFESIVLGTENYHLKTGSALIDAGTDTYSVVTDIDGVVSGSRNDISFDEIVVSGLIVDSDGSFRCLYKKRNISDIEAWINNRGSSSSIVASDVGFSSQISFPQTLRCLFSESINVASNVLALFKERLHSSSKSSVSNSSGISSSTTQEIIVGSVVEEDLQNLLQHSISVSADEYTPLLWSGSLSTISDLVSDILHSSSLQYAQAHTIWTSTGVVGDVLNNISHKQNIAETNEHTISFSELLNSIENIPTLYLGGLGITSDGKFDIAFRGISEALSSFAINLSSSTSSTLSAPLEHKEVIDRVEELSVKYSKLVNAVEDISLIWGGGLGVDSTSNFPVIHRGGIEQYQNKPISSSSIISTSISTTSIFKQRVELSVEEAVGYLSSIGMNENLLSNFSSVLLVDESVGVKWSNLEDALYVDGDAELWVLNERGTVWRLF